MSPRSQLATRGSRPIAACSAACRAPGIRAGSIPLCSRASDVTVYITAVVARLCSGISSSTKSITSPEGERRRKPITWWVTDTGTRPSVTAPYPARSPVPVTVMSVISLGYVAYPGSSAWTNATLSSRLSESTR